jgi:hypothetical protein
MKKNLILLALLSLSLTIPSFAQREQRGGGDRGGQGREGRVGGGYIPPRGPAPAARQAPQQRVPEQRQAPVQQRQAPVQQRQAPVQQQTPCSSAEAVSSAVFAIFKGIRKLRTFIPAASGSGTTWVATIGAIISIIPGNTAALHWASDQVTSSVSKVEVPIDSGSEARTLASLPTIFLTCPIGSGIPIPS